MEKSEILDFVKTMKPRDHVIMFYTDKRDKHLVLFTYLKAGLDRSEAAAYVASEESPSQIRQAMRRFGIQVDDLEKSGALHVIDYKNWYIIGNRFNIDTTISLWKKLLDEAIVKGFKGLRVTGEMACFFKHDMVNELVEYERALHRVLKIPLTAICAYDDTVVNKGAEDELYFRLYLDLIMAHSTIIFLGPEEAGVIRSLRKGM